MNKNSNLVDILADLVQKEEQKKLKKLLKFDEILKELMSVVVYKL